MAKIIAGLASSHAFALIDPKDWDARRERNLLGYQQRYGVAPPVHPKIAEENGDIRMRKHESVRNGLDFLRDAVKRSKPDAIILVGDDQNENFVANNLPQLAVYLGDSVVTTDRGKSGQRERGPSYRCHSRLAKELLHGLVERDFDVASCASFAHDELLSHAHAPIMNRLDPAAEIPFILLFVNAIHVPAISPARCYRLGQAISDILDQNGSEERVAIYASGGLSHFTSGYPWPHYKGPFGYGSISEEFDRELMAVMARGEGEILARLKSSDLLEHGDIEFRSWMVLLGAIGNVPTKVNVYEPIYSAIGGMGVAYWDLENNHPS
jgi:aromatic ring-opening dioxygenase catalytic subunit (LigB family)